MWSQQFIPPPAMRRPSPREQVQQRSLQDILDELEMADMFGGRGAAMGGQPSYMAGAFTGTQGRGAGADWLDSYKAKQKEKAAAKGTQQRSSDAKTKGGPLGGLLF
jgi:hypothetical protein